MTTQGVATGSTYSTRFKDLVVINGTSGRLIGLAVTGGDLRQRLHVELDGRTLVSDEVFVNSYLSSQGASLVFDMPFSRSVLVSVRDEPKPTGYPVFWGTYMTDFSDPTSEEMERVESELGFSALYLNRRYLGKEREEYTVRTQLGFDKSSVTSIEGAPEIRTPTQSRVKITAQRLVGGPRGHGWMHATDVEVEGRFPVLGRLVGATGVWEVGRVDMERGSGEVELAWPRQWLAFPPLFYRLPVLLWPDLPQRANIPAQFVEPL